MSTGRRKQQVGRWGEQVAAASLERKGWTILEMNVESYRRRAAQASQPSAHKRRQGATTPTTA